MGYNKKVQKEWLANIADILSDQNDERRASDQKRIHAVREMIVLDPLGRKLLDWADENGIVILVDNQTTSGGYYVSGLNTIGLSGMDKDYNLVGALAHEIRHAWQDSEGLLTCLSSKYPLPKVQEYMLQTRFFEADAHAVGNKVKKSVINLVLDSTGHEAKNLDEKLELLKGFKAFFKDRSTKDLYDKIKLRDYADRIGIVETKPPFGGSEYDNEVDFSKLHSKGVDVNDENSIRKLGSLFGDGNYLDDLPENFHRNQLYCGDFAFSSLIKDKREDSRILDYLMQDFDMALTGKKIEHSKIDPDAVLFRRVKHLQNKHKLKS